MANVVQSPVESMTFQENISKIFTELYDEQIASKASAALSSDFKPDLHRVLWVISNHIMGTNQKHHISGSGLRATGSTNSFITSRELESRQWSKRQNAANLVYFRGISFVTHCLVFFNVSGTGLLDLMYFQNTAGYWKGSQTVRCWSVSGMSSLWVNLWLISCILSYERDRCLMISKRCDRISKFRAFFRGLQNCGYYEIGWDDRSEVL